MAILTFIVVRIADGQRWKKSAFIGMLTMWFLALIYLMFLYRLPGMRTPAINLNAFHMFREAGNYGGPIEKNQALRQILFNVLLYVPFGVIVGALSNRTWLTIFYGIVLSIITEIIQYLTGLGMADIDDVISNAIGLMIGTAIHGMIK